VRTALSSSLKRLLNVFNHIGKRVGKRQIGGTELLLILFQTEEELSSILDFLRVGQLCSQFRTGQHPHDSISTAFGVRTPPTQVYILHGSPSLLEMYWYRRCPLWILQYTCCVKRGICWGPQFQRVLSSQLIHAYWIPAMCQNAFTATFHFCSSLFRYRHVGTNQLSIPPLLWSLFTAPSRRGTCDYATIFIISQFFCKPGIPLRFLVRMSC
jgi:hypothetical protein